MPDHLKSLRRLAGDITYTSLDDGSRLSFDDEMIESRIEGESYMESSMALMRSKAKDPSRPVAFRLDYHHGGRSDYCVFSDDTMFVINAGIRVGSEPLTIQYLMKKYCVLRIQLRGRMEEKLGREQNARYGSDCSLIYPGEGIRYGFVLQGPQPIYSATIQFPASMLTEFLTIDQLEQLEMFKEGSANPASQFIRIPSSPQLLEFGHQLVALDLTQTTARLAGKGLMLQLIGEAVGSVLRRAETRPDVTRLRQHDIERLNAIRARMDEALDAPHSIDDLARWGGLNRRKLTEGFKVLFGATVADYLQRKRMMAARDLLETGESVGAAAEAVGYQDRTSFSRAFRKVYGHSPMDSRQASRPLAAEPRSIK